MAENHREFMGRCIELARRGRFLTAPNPIVGSVLVKDGKIIAEGFHERYGSEHAEVNCLKHVTDPGLISGATLYVNLEPCSHHGKTPPCAEYLVKLGIKNVVIACRDTSRKVNGRGIEILKKSGVEVVEDVCYEEARFLNRRFFTFHEKNRPYIILKWAQTKDGFIADQDRRSKWISSEESRALVHIWRAEESAIIVGTGTALADDPLLTARPEITQPFSQPLRVVVDRDLKLPAAARVLNSDAPTLVINSVKTEKRLNVEYYRLDFSKPVLNQLLELLHSRSITSLFVEGGAVLLESFISSDLFDEARVFTAPKRFNAGIRAPQLGLLKPAAGISSGPDRLDFYANHGYSFRHEE